jgi:hypothetical protein
MVIRTPFLAAIRRFLSPARDQKLNTIFYYAMDR